VSPDKQSAQRVVIVGGGFAGAYCAQALGRGARAGLVLPTLIDRNNYFVFHPLLVEAGTGSLEPRHAVVSIRSFLRSAEFRMAEVVGARPARSEIDVRPVGGGAVDTLTYDHLVLALGSVTRMPNVPGLREHGWEMKGVADAVALRDRAIAMVESASLARTPEERRAALHFVVVGANFTGVEVAGEFHVFLRNVARRHGGIDPDECSMTLVELSDRVLSALRPELSDYALRNMTRRGIRIRLGTSVRAIEADRVVLDNGETIAARTAIWCAGIAPSPLLAKLGIPLDAKGYVASRPDLRVEGFENVWAAGDCAAIRDGSGTLYPATAQHAIREGVHVAKNVLRRVQGQPTLPFAYTTQGSLAALGCRTGVAEVFGVKLSGFPAWFLWRTVYLLKMPGLARKVRIALDWTMDLLFPRDFVQLGVHRQHTTQE